MQKKAFILATSTNSTTTSRTIENVIAAEKRIQEAIFPTPPSEEMVARLNAMAREYPFCAYIKQGNSYLL